MPTVRPLVDVEAVVIDHLAEELDGTGTAVAGEVPPDFPPAGAGFVQVFRATATDTALGHVERAVVQVNAYGRSKPDAFDLFSVVFVALLELPDQAAPPGAVVSDVRRLTGPTWAPDPVTDAARYTGSFRLTVHPAPIPTP